jgi:hypothetical protein
MTTVLTKDLEGNTLDWAVAKCEGLDASQIKANGPVHLFRTMGYDPLPWQPSSSWSQGGPIMEREIDSYDKSGNVFQAVKLDAQGNYSMFDHVGHDGFGHSPLIAAMRCYVKSKFGPEIQVPNELLDTPKTNSKMGVSP